MDKKHSLKIKTRWFEAVAEGPGGLVALVIVCIIVVSARAFGWW